jgi:choline kinase
MRACILAAGIGQRLRPLTDDKPKALVEVDGKSFLDRLVTQLVSVGVTELIVATGFREDAVARALEKAPIPVVLCRNEAFDRTQNSVSLHACADALLAGGAQPTFKLDGDVILDVEVLQRLLGAFEKTGAGLLAAVDRHVKGDLGAEEMKVKLAGNPGEGANRITAFGKGLDPRTAAGESIGVELLSAPAVSSIVDALGVLVTSGTTDLYYEDVYDRLLLAKGGALDARAVFVDDLPWTEVDTASDLARAGEIARRTRLS